MSKKYIGDDYTLNIFARNIEDNKALIASSSVSQNVTTEQQQVTVLEGHTYLHATSSYQILSGTAAFHSSFASPPHTAKAFGFGTVVSGNIAVVGRHIASEVVSRNDEYAGVLILHSSSAGWSAVQEIAPTASLLPYGDQSGTPLPWAGGFAKNFDFDTEDGKHIVICAQDASAYNYGVPLTGKVFVYSSASSGWYLAQTITTGSLPASISFTNNSVDDYYTAGYEGWASSARVSGDHISIGSLRHNRVSGSLWDQPDFAESFDTSPGVVVFKSSSSGFVFDTFLDGYDIHNDGGNAYAIDSNLSHDLRSGRCVFAGDGGWTNAQYYQGAGKIRSWLSGSSGWVNEGSLDLNSVGLTASVSSTYPAISGSNASHGPQPLDGEYKLYTYFGRQGLATSGSYIVAAAKPRTGINSRTVAGRIFIIKSGSTGWSLEASFKSPNPNTEGTGGDMYNDYFGAGGLSIERGRIVATSPYYKYPKSGGGFQSPAGRAHVYKSSSVSGWTFEQTIDNPFSGSAAIDDSSSGRHKFGLPYSPLAGTYDYFMAPTQHNGSLFISFQELVKDVTGSAAYGGVYLLEGSASYKQETQNVEVTESVNVVDYILSPTNFAPFIKAVNGPMNIRLQSGSSTPFSSEHGGSKN